MCGVGRDPAWDTSGYAYHAIKIQQASTQARHGAGHAAGRDGQDAHRGSEGPASQGAMGTQKWNINRRMGCKGVWRGEEVVETQEDRTGSGEVGQSEWKRQHT